MPSEGLKILNLKDSLKKVELAILSSDFETAEKVYSEIFENWRMFEEALKAREQEAKECLALVEYLEKLLEEKREEILRQIEFSKVRRAYALRSIK
jgi:chromosome segregation ATPase